MLQVAPDLSTIGVSLHCIGPPSKISRVVQYKNLVQYLCNHKPVPKSAQGLHSHYFSFFVHMWQSKCSTNQS